MAQGIVDLLEAVEIDQHHRTRPALRRKCSESAFQHAGHPATIGQAGQGIGRGQLRGFCSGLAIAGNIDDVAPKTAELADCVSHRFARYRPQRFDIAVFAACDHRFKAALAREDEGQCALTVDAGARGHEQAEEILARRRIAVRQWCSQCPGQVRDAPLGIGRPEPAQVQRFERAAHVFRGQADQIV